MDYELILLQMNLDAGREAIEDVRQAYIDLELANTVKYGRPGFSISKYVCDYARDVTADLKAAQAENARLREVYKASSALIRSHLYVGSEADKDACFAELFRVCEALQPTRCPACNGAGVVSIRNGDDSTACPACGDKPMSDEELVEEVTGR